MIANLQPILHKTRECIEKTVMRAIGLSGPLAIGQLRRV